MRSLIILAALAAVLAAPKYGQAQEYPWCAVQHDSDGEISTCGYVSRQQCMDTVSGGSGGYCRMNPYLTVPQPQSRPAKKTRQPS